MYPTRNMSTFECTSCEGTYTGLETDLHKLGWTQPHRKVRLCDECTAWYKERRELAKLEGQFV